MTKKPKLLAPGNKSNSVWVLLLGVSAVTLYFNTKLDDPFNTPKLILLLILSGWIFGHLINSFREKPVILKSSEFKILTLFVLFVTTLCVSTLYTDVQLVGFIGDTQRRNGFLGYFGLAVIFLYASRVMNLYYSIRVIKIAIIVGLSLSSYGVMQILGKDFVEWNNPYNSMISTLGNPNFASALLAILTLLAVGSLFLKSISKIYKAMALSFILMSIFSIIESQSRQGLITLLFASLISLTIFIVYNYKKLKFVVLPLTVSTGTLAILGMLQKGPLSQYLYKDSVSVRGYYWRAGLEMLKEKPFTGVGVDSYGSYFKEFREVSYPLKYGYEITSSNAHNTIIQLFGTAGIFVGLCYLAIIFSVVVAGLKLINQNKGEKQKIVLVIFTSWVGFQAQSLISIDNIGISVWGWLLGGTIIGIAHQADDHTNIDMAKNIKINRVRINLFQPMMSAIILIPILIISTFIYKFERDTYMVRVYATSTSQEDKALLLKYFRDVADNPFSDPYYKFKSSLIIYDAGFADQAHIELQKLLIQDPVNLGFLNASAYFAMQRRDIDLAIKLRMAITQRDPWNALNYIELGALYSAINNKTEAKKMFQKVLDFAPDTEQAKLSKINMDKL
jgi:O-antigen ligase